MKISLNLALSKRILHLFKFISLHWSIISNKNLNMPGRKQKPLSITIQSIFEENQSKIIDERKKVMPPASNIWETLRKGPEIAKKMSAKAIYSAALRWWTDKNENSDLGNISVESNPTNLADMSYETDPPEASDSDGSYCSGDDKPRANDINFSISLSKDAWETIQPIATKNRRNDKSHKVDQRTYYTLPPGLWTNILTDKIAQHRIKNPCTWSFKRAKVYPNGEKYIKFSAKCTTCDAYLIGELSKIPKKGENVKFKLTVREFNEEKHDETRKNVRIGASKAKELFTSQKKASVLKREMIQESGAKMFEADKGRSISENAIRAGQFRQRQLNKLSTEPLQALQFLKCSNTFGPMIHFIGADPFVVIYASANQFLLYNTYKKSNRYIKASADATGSVVHKLCRFIIKHVFLSFTINSL